MSNIIMKFFEEHSEGIIILIVSIVIPSVIGIIRLMKNDILVSASALLKQVQERMETDIELLEDRTLEMKAQIEKISEKQRYLDGQLDRFETRLEKTIRQELRQELKKQEELTAVNHKFMKEHIDTLQKIIVGYFTDRIT